MNHNLCAVARVVIGEGHRERTRGDRRATDQRNLNRARAWKIEEQRVADFELRSFQSRKGPTQVRAHFEISRGKLSIIDQAQLVDALLRIAALREGIKSHRARKQRQHADRSDTQKNRGSEVLHRKRVAGNKSEEERARDWWMNAFAATTRGVREKLPRLTYQHPTRNLGKKAREHLFTRRSVSDLSQHDAVAFRGSAPSCE